MEKLQTYSEFLNEDNQSAGNPTVNFKVYQELCKSYPHFKTILEDKLGTSARYAIHEIWEQNDSVVFYMKQSFKVNKSIIDLMKKYEIEIQVPGNKSYTFSVDINKK